MNNPWRGRSRTLEQRSILVHAGEFGSSSIVSRRDRIVQGEKWSNKKCLCRWHARKHTSICQNHFNSPPPQWLQLARGGVSVSLRRDTKSVITLWSFCIISWCKNVSASASFLPPLRGVTTSKPLLPRRLWIPVTSVRWSRFCSVSGNWIQFRVEDLVLYSRPL